MNNQEIRAALERNWEATVALDLDRVHDIYHDDLIVEFPQSPGCRVTVVPPAELANAVLRNVISLLNLGLMDMCPLRYSSSPLQCSNISL